MFLRGHRAVIGFSCLVILVALSLSLAASHRIAGQLEENGPSPEKVNPPQSVQTSPTDSDPASSPEYVPGPEYVAPSASTSITPPGNAPPTAPVPPPNMRPLQQIMQSKGQSSVSSQKKAPSSADSIKKSVVLCGNGKKDVKEECDYGRWNGEGVCTKACKLFICGDGILSRQIGEECEPKKVQTGEEPSCGIVCTTPQKDKKSPLYGGCYWKFLDACPASEESTLALQGSALQESYLDTAPTTSVDDPDAPIAEEVITGECGNGVKEQVEECDEADGNADDVPNACRTNCLTPRCGDGVIDGGEECDGDEECSDLCEWTTTEPLILDPYGDIEAVIHEAESILKQTEQDSAISGETCGNAMLEGEEECDDGNDIDGDGCSILCEVDVFHGAPGALESDQTITSTIPLWTIILGIIAAAAALGQWIIRRNRESIVLSDEI